MANSLGLLNKSISGELYPDYKVIITNSYPSGSKNITLTGVLSEGLSLTGQSSDGDEWSLMEEIKGKFGGVTQIADNMMSKMLGSAATTTSVSGTRVKWTGTSNPSFNLSLIFSSTAGADQNLKTALSNLNKIQYPASTTNLGFGEVYEAPLGYSPGIDEDERSKLLFTVTIGTWFKSLNYWTVNPSNIVIDTIFDGDGKPMLLTADLELTAWQLPTADEVNRWFIL